MLFDVGKGPEIEESELPALKMLHNMGYEYKSKSDLNKERKKLQDFLLYDRLKKMIEKLNPWMDDEQVASALSQLSEDSFAHHLDHVQTNEEVRAKLIGLSRTGGLIPVTVSQITSTGHEYKDVKIIDFDNPLENDFLVTNQFQMEGFKRPKFPDIIIFVNGIPLVIIECKSPFITKPIDEAVEDNLHRYQERKQGYDKLFFYNHCMIATCGTLARHGTLDANVNHYAPWTESYPYSEEEVKKLAERKPRQQEYLIAGMLSKENLLNSLKNYVVYDVADSKKIKKIAKHQQFRAVEKLLSIVRTSSKSEKRGGVVWHTQGSGKSYTMLWFAAKLKKEFKNKPVIVVTDRKQLDKQIKDTFANSGLQNPVRAKDSKHLAELLANPKGQTIMTTIQKFDRTDMPVNSDEKIVVLADEAHRTQYKIQAEAMDKVLSDKAIKFAFTGTPLNKNEKHNTYRVFGEPIDKYTYEESKKDGSTLKIEYDNRFPKLYVEGGETIDQIFDRIFAKESEDLKQRLKRECVTKSDIHEAPARIKKVAWNILQHYTKKIMPNGYKAMIVAPSREAAVTYKTVLDEYSAPPSKIIMDCNPNEVGKDGKSWEDYYLTDKQLENETDAFKEANNPIKILIVVDMLLVGFDAPIVQVMYLDHTLKEHNLLQAIARVNRPYDEGKDRGYIIDYCGVTKDMATALKNYDSQDVIDLLYSVDEKLAELKVRHRNVMSYFEGIDKNDKEAILLEFETIDMRDKFEYDFKAFSRVFDSVLPGEEADPYVDDFGYLVNIRNYIRNHYEPIKESTRPFAKKVQKLIDDHIRSMDVRDLMPPIEVTFENFKSFIGKIKNPRAQAALVKTRTKQVIDELYYNNPIYYEKLREILERLISEEEQRRKSNTEYFIPVKEFEIILEKALGEEIERKKVFGDNYNAEPIEFAIYGELNEQSNDPKLSLDLTKKLWTEIKSVTEKVGWRGKPSSDRAMKTAINDILSSSKFPEDKIALVTEKIIMDIINKK